MITLNINLYSFFFRSLISIIIISFLSFTIINILELLNPYTRTNIDISVINELNRQSYIIFFLFTSIVLIFKSKSYNKINISATFEIDRFLEILNIILLISILIVFFSKYFLYYLDHIINLIDNNFPLACYPTSIRSFWLNSPSDNSAGLIYNLLSPIGIILINFLYSVIFLIIIFFEKLKKKTLINSLIFLLLSILIYFISNFSKIIIFNAIFFLMTAIVVRYCLGKKITKKIIFFSSGLILIFIFLIFQTVHLRSTCIKQYVDSNYDLNLEYKEERLEKDRYIQKSISGDKFLFIKNFHEFIYNNNNNKFVTTFVYVSSYLLSGKQNGDYLITNKDRVENKLIFFKEVYNSIVDEFYKLGFSFIYQYDFNEFYDNKPPPVSTISMLYLDFKKYSLFLFFIIIILPIMLLILLFKKHFFLLLTFSTIAIFSSFTFMVFNPFLVLNTKYFFALLMLTLFFIFKNNKIKKIY